MDLQVTRLHVRPDVTYLHLHDAPPLRWGLVWRSDSDNELVRAFVGIVRELGTMQLRLRPRLSSARGIPARRPCGQGVMGGISAC
ncbi:hypothetical protein [Streptomyces purpureus]|uniref:LysR substrate-binding domain-containing protein n=1 Tax=Streptomyces purpureus TaxID=1951 RepID=A0A918HDI3_9ACTN|nr:hypothetical protein [Streptomyces purpureus]GGT50535.1 hypothetical protein GCM10014713_50720 [Streptomyces purpureus]